MEYSRSASSGPSEDTLRREFEKAIIAQLKEKDDATSYIITVERVEPGDWIPFPIPNGHSVSHRVDPAMSMRDLRKVLHTALDIALDAAGPPNG